MEIVLLLRPVLHPSGLWIGKNELMQLTFTYVQRTIDTNLYTGDCVANSKTLTSCSPKTTDTCAVCD